MSTFTGLTHFFMFCHTFSSFDILSQVLTNFLCFDIFSNNLTHFHLLSQALIHFIKLWHTISCFDTLSHILTHFLRFWHTFSCFDIPVQIFDRLSHDTLLNVFTHFLIFYMQSNLCITNDHPWDKKKVVVVQRVGLPRKFFNQKKWGRGIDTEALL